MKIDMKRSIWICVLMLCAFGITALAYNHRQFEHQYRKWSKMADDRCQHCYYDKNEGYFMCALCRKPFDMCSVLMKGDDYIKVEYYHGNVVSNCDHCIGVVYYN